MWDLTGLELMGVYGTWSGRSYELVNHEAEIITLVMSAEEAPGPDWAHRTPDDFYGESLRWELNVPRTEVTDVHTTIVQGTMEGHFVDVLAQRHDRAWAISAENPPETLIELLRRLGVVPAGSAWSGWGFHPGSTPLEGLRPRQRQSKPAPLITHGQSLMRSRELLPPLTLRTRHPRERLKDQIRRCRSAISRTDSAAFHLRWSSVTSFTYPPRIRVTPVR